MIKNHAELMELWDWSLSVLKPRVQGVKAMMPKFSFFFVCALGELLLRQTDNLSKSLQDSRMSAVEGQALAELVIHGQKSGTFSGRGCWLRNYSIAKNSIKKFLI